MINYIINRSQVRLEKGSRSQVARMDLTSVYKPKVRLETNSWGQAPWRFGFLILKVLGARIRIGRSWTWTSADQALSLGLKSAHINTLQ